MSLSSEQINFEDYLKLLLNDLGGGNKYSKPYLKKIFNDLIATLVLTESITNKHQYLEKIHAKIYLFKNENQEIPLKTLQSLDNILNVLIQLLSTVNSLEKEMKIRYWNVLLIEELFTKLFSLTDFLQKQIKQHDTHESIHILKKLLPSEIINHEAFIEALIYRKKFSILKILNSQEFQLKLKRRLNSLNGMRVAPPNESVYISQINEIHQMFLLLNSDEKMTVFSVIDPIIIIPFLSTKMFLLLLPLASPLQQEFFKHLRTMQWIQNFEESLRCGNVDQLHSCIADLQLGKSIFDDGKMLSILEPSGKIFFEEVLKLKTADWMTKGVSNLFKSQLENRIEKINSNFDSLTDKGKELFGEIKKISELGIALQAIHLLEHFMQKTGNAEQIKTINFEIEIVLTILQENSNDFPRLFSQEPLFFLKPMHNHLSPLQFATEVVLLGQRKNQLQFGIYSIQKKKHSLDFYHIFHRLLAKQIEFENNSWTMIICIFKTIYSISNQLFLAQSGNLFYGVWDNVSKNLQELLKIYLPKAEYSSWKYHCSFIDPKKTKLKRAMKFSYNGSQKTFGLWFHLCTKAAAQFIVQGHTWERTLHYLGMMRQIIALAMRGIAFPEKGLFSYSATKKMQPLLKTIASPGPPLNFGSLRFEREHDGQRTYFSLPKRVYYMKMIFDKIQLLDEMYGDELPPLYNQHGSFGHGKEFTLGGANFVVYPTWKREENMTRTYAINYPVSVDGKDVEATWMLWNWPERLPFFSKGNVPLRLDFDFLGAWGHPSENNKIALDGVIEALFHRLLNKSLSPNELDKLLAKFVYLFFQSQPYLRGSGAIGIILYNAILFIHGRKAPTAPPPGRSIDCEALCMDETEFCKKYVAWLNNKNSFDF